MLAQIASFFPVSWAAAILVEAAVITSLLALPVYIASGGVLAVAVGPAGRWGRLVLVGLVGPSAFSTILVVLFVPLALVRLYVHRDRTSAVLLGLLLAGAARLLLFGALVALLLPTGRLGTALAGRLDTAPAGCLGTAPADGRTRGRTGPARRWRGRRGASRPLNVCDRGVEVAMTTRTSAAPRSSARGVAAVAWHGGGMCRNFRVLHNFEPPATEDEIEAAAVQYVRKVSGTTRPSAANQEVFDEAVRVVAAATRTLLDGLVTKALPRDRDVEAAKARARASERYGSPTAAAG